ncbi:MAG: hypothetical protein IANPNBLG_02040 [Bryobacteraceae bacterium]|nr:hypothetical protein [Bryobacteraceae bacterium]
MIAGAGDGAARERIRHSLGESPRRVDFSAAAVRGDGGGLGGKPVKFSRLYYRTRRAGDTGVSVAVTEAGQRNVERASRMGRIEPLERLRSIS